MNLAGLPLFRRLFPAPPVEPPKKASTPKDLDLLVTLWPSFDHFPDFANDNRISGIRLNSAMMSSSELEEELARIDSMSIGPSLFFDVKGRQLRVEEVHPNDEYLDLTLNRPIKVETPVVVLFKAAADRAILERVEEDGRRLIFRGGPQYMVRAGESLHIRHPSMQVFGPPFTDIELRKIAQVKEAGFRHYFLSYVERQSDVDMFRELIGRDSEVWLKIENDKGLRYIANEFKKEDALTLVAARGDLFVEVDRPHDILAATKLILEKDPMACVGSRLLLSIIQEPVPSCADLSELAWLYDIGYRRMMLCDELCLKGDLLNTAVNVFDSFRNSYGMAPKV